MTEPKIEVLVSKWDGEKFYPEWKCHECRIVATVVRDGFTHYMETRYICLNCLEKRIKAIQEAILESKIEGTKSCSAINA